MVFSTEYKVIDLGAVNGESGSIDTKNFEVASIVIVTTGAWDGTLTPIGSQSDKTIDPAAGASDSNQYFTVQSVLLDNGSFVAGSTGITQPINGVQGYEINVNRLKQLGFQVTGVTKGTVKVYLVLWAGNNRD